MKMSKYFVFDVESIGLHGEGWAVGWVVIDEDGKECESGCLACPPEAAEGDEDGRKWVMANIPPITPNVPMPVFLRESFWEAWERARATWNAQMVTDCGWPVEARFLAACVDDDPINRRWKGPYPLLDVASVRLAAGLDPLGTEERKPDELPAHHPLADARQSARLFVEALTAAGPHLARALEAARSG
jgi:hypothetical protein